MHTLFENWTWEFAGGIAIGFIAGLTLGSWLYFGREMWAQRKNDTDLHLGG